MQVLRGGCCWWEALKGGWKKTRQRPQVVTNWLLGFANFTVITSFVQLLFPSDYDTQLCIRQTRRWPHHLYLLFPAAVPSRPLGCGGICDLLLTNRKQQRRQEAHDRIYELTYMQSDWNIRLAESVSPLLALGNKQQCWYEPGSWKPRQEEAEPSLVECPRKLKDLQRSM